jgi:integrase
MTLSRELRRFHTKNSTPKDSTLCPYEKWIPANQAFYIQYRTWLKEGGYKKTTINVYCVAARLALGFLNQPYEGIDPEKDLQRVREHMVEGALSLSTQSYYCNGLDKLAQYLYQRTQRKQPDPDIHWETYTHGLPNEWVSQLQAYLALRSRNWLPTLVYERKINLLSSLSKPLRWLADRGSTPTFLDITPEHWYDYVEYRLQTHINPRTINGERYLLQSFLNYLSDQGIAVCQRMSRVETSDEPNGFPRDIPVELLHQIMAVIKATHKVSGAYARRSGIMDYAWMLLMLHCGLRTGEVRRLKLADLDWGNRRVRIEQSKGLKDRLVFLSPDVITALKAYLEVRGACDGLPKEVFIHHNQSFGSRYCQRRLMGYSKTCGTHVTPHQLRHSCATLLLNAGAPVIAVQTILGHAHLDTTMGYARLYDKTVAADYYRAMVEIEG